MMISTILHKITQVTISYLMIPNLFFALPASALIRPGLKVHYSVELVNFNYFLNNKQTL